MKPLCLVAMIVMTSLVVGCQQPVAGVAAKDQAVTTDGLKTTLTVSDRYVYVGQKLTVTLTAENTGAKAIEINSPSAAKALFTIAEQGGPWRTRRPTMAAAVMTPWTLPAGESRTFQEVFTVAKDWPMATPLRLTGRINGRENATTEVSIEAYETKSQCDRKRVY